MTAYASCSGGAWLTICTLANAFCNDFFAFVTMRALAGLGGALIMPNAVAMISSTNPPGRVRKFESGFLWCVGPIRRIFWDIVLGCLSTSDRMEVAFRLHVGDTFCGPRSRSTNNALITQCLSRCDHIHSSLGFESARTSGRSSWKDRLYWIGSWNKLIDSVQLCLESSTKCRLVNLL
ncbi:hypothetical protein N7516_005664 [Penicillium verrucosum]|uniref:uncharacterized protein n=1 Tax=Penicillium verrucosum TaxID=60171 RepID=UPI002545726E|nr:uncharacterized protein N7516_005664 [Penicillium verrucosum]KAJ5931175.1 hypothetical protein N7516_005664 [Penicillium verrucosum]